MSRKRLLPPAIGRADLLRSGVALPGSDTAQARWFGFGFKAYVEPEEIKVTLRPISEDALGFDTVPMRIVEHLNRPSDPYFCSSTRTLPLDAPATDIAPPATQTPRVAPVPGGEPPPLQPLASDVQLKRLIQPILTHSVTARSPDVPRIIRRIARAEPMITVPRRARHSPATRLQCIVDRSTRLTPVWEDQRLVVAALRRQFRDMALDLWVYEEAAGRLQPLMDTAPDTPQPERGPLLAITDLGAFGTVADSALWRPLARQFRAQAVTAAALVPGRAEQFSSMMAGPWNVLPWEVESLPEDRNSSELNARMAALCSMAIRLDPSLLRALRKCCFPHASVADEITLWCSPLLEGHSAEAATFDSQMRDASLRKLVDMAQAEPELVAEAVTVLHTARQGLAPDIWFEEVLGLPEVLRANPDIVAPGHLAEAETHFATLRFEAAQGTLQQNQTAWLARAGRRQGRHGLWRNAQAAHAMRDALKNDPDFVPPLIVQEDAQAETQHARVVLDTNGNVRVSDKFLLGLELGTLAYASGVIERLTEEGSDRRELLQSPRFDKKTNDGTPDDRMVLQTDRGRMVLDRMTAASVPWANAFGCDDQGIWADIQRDGRTWRFRWIPPGHGVSGPDPHDESSSGPSETDSFEFSYATGFWLMDRPLDLDQVSWLQSAYLGEAIDSLATKAPQPVQKQGISRTERTIPDLPALASFHEAQTFADQARRTLHPDIRLPDVTMWEFAARAGVSDAETYAVPTDSPVEEDANLSDIAVFRPRSDAGRDHPDRQAPSGTRHANGWGLHDMLGNVAEWCLPAMPSGDTAPVKGGSWSHHTRDIRFSYREDLDVAKAHDWVGLRLALGTPELEWKRARTAYADFGVTPNLPPRVQLSYPDVKNSEREIELPVVAGVLADLAGETDIGPLEERGFVRVDAEGFDAFMLSLSPRLHLPLTIVGQEQNDEAEMAYFNFRSFSDFSPDALLEQVSVVSTSVLRDHRARRNQLAQTMRVLDALSDPSRRRLNKFLKSRRGTSVQVEYMKELRKALASDPAANKTLTEFDLTQTQMLLNTMLASPPRGMTSISTIETMLHTELEKVDNALSKFLDGILHHPKFQTLERAWRGLHYLVHNTETSDGLQIHVMPLSKGELDQTIGMDSDQISDLSRLILDGAVSDTGPAPFSILIGDYQFTHDDNDLLVLRALGMTCDDAKTSFIAAAAPELCGVESWEEITYSKTFKDVMNGPDYDNWYDFRDGIVSLYLSLTMPRMLARGTYDDIFEDRAQFSYSEIIDTYEDHCWMNSAYAMGANVLRAFHLHGWPGMIEGVSQGGIVENLPTVFVETESDDTIEVLCPTETDLPDTRALDLMQAGLSPLIHRANTDKAVFAGARTLSPSRVSGTDEQNPFRIDGDGRLSFVLATNLILRHLTCLARDTLNETTDPETLVTFLQDWLGRYVQQDIKETSTQNAGQPLAHASIKLADVKDGIYAFDVVLAPAYQLHDTKNTFASSFTVSARPSAAISSDTR